MLNYVNYNVATMLFATLVFFANTNQASASTNYTPCGKPDDLSVSDSKVFVWKECSGSGAWRVLTKTSKDATPTRFYGSIRNDGQTSVTGYKLEKHDKLDSTNPKDVQFLLRLWKNAQDGLSINAAENTRVCLNIQGSNNGIIYLGKSGTKLSTNFDLNTGQSCGLSSSSTQGTAQTAASKSIPANAECGRPDFDPATETGPWLWRDCGASGGKWHFRMAAGGNNDLRFSGSFLSDQDFIDVSEFDVDDNDEVTPVSDQLVGFDYRAWGSSVDGLDVRVVSGSTSCFDIYGIDPSQLSLGENKVPAPALPLNLETFESCEPTPEPDALSFLVILTDDQRFDTTWVMQELQNKVFSRSVVFENAYSTTPLCCPARASILSGGFFPYNTGIFQVIGDNGGDLSFRGDQDRDTIATTLQQLGYKTAFTGGKYLNDYRPPYIPPGWDFFLNNDAGPSADEWFEYAVTKGSAGVTAGRGETENVAQYVADYHRDELLGFLDGLESDEPFLAFYSVFAPHGPARPHPDDDQAGIIVDGVDLDSYVYKERAFNEHDLSDKPDWVSNPNRFLSAKSTGTGDDDEFHRDQLRTLLSVDRAIGQLVDRLEALGRLDKTVIIFTSDNGYMWGEHGIHQKGSAYEESVKVPFSIYVPGVAPRFDSSIMSINLDIGPTIYELAGVNKPSEGMSLVPLLNNPASNWRNSLQLQGWGPHEGANGTWSAIRTEQWKYIENAIGETELYDIVYDQYETDSLHNDPSFESVKLELADTVANNRGLGPTVFRTPNGTLAQPYSFQLTAWGGTKPYNWSINNVELPDGTMSVLPDGLTLDSDTGIISGTPTLQGTFTFQIVLKDSSVRPKTGEPQSYIAPGRPRNNFYTITIN